MKSISIIITCYNKEKYIDRAIRSCLSLKQESFHLNIIVVNDCSTDNSVEVIRRFENKITFINLTHNHGVAAASNIGIAALKCDYWMRVDGDDYISNNALLHMFPILEQNSEISFVYANHVRVDELSNVENYVSLNDLETLYQHGAGVLFRSNIFKNEKIYDEDFRNAEDYKLLKNLIDCKHKGFHLPIYLYRYYIHGNNLTMNEDRKNFIIRAKNS